MLTLSDLNKAAQAKKAAQDVMQTVAQATLSATNKVKSVVTTAKDAVVGVMPVTTKTFNAEMDQAKLDLFTLLAMQEQRLEALEKKAKIQPQIDGEALLARVEEWMTLSKKLHIPTVVEEVEEPTAQEVLTSAQLVEQAVRTAVEATPTPKRAAVAFNRPLRADQALNNN